ncbi:membrane protein [Kitasatospora sp. NE20-6]
MSDILLFDYLNPFWWLAMAIIGFKLFALVDAALRRDDAYRAADKKTKGFWLIVLGLALGLDLLLGAYVLSNFLTLIGLVAAIVYMVDVRPAIKQLTDGRGGGRRNIGPYGPW